MNTNFISPLPYPPFPPIDQRTLMLGPYSLADCVYFFWNLRAVKFSVSANIVIGFEDSPDIFQKVQIQTTVDSYNSGSICSLEPQRRALANGYNTFASAGNEEISVSVSGPYYYQEYAPDAPLISKQFVFYATPAINSSFVSFMDSADVPNDIKILSSHQFTALGRSSFFHGAMLRKYFEPFYSTQASISAVLSFSFY